MTSGKPGALYAPRAVQVRCRAKGRPEAVGGKRIDSVREEWLVEDRWWSSEPMRRHYLELVLETGHCSVVFCDLETGHWYEQR